MYKERGSFYHWLKNWPLSERVAGQHVQNVVEYKHWCAKQLISDPDRLNYAEVLEYAKTLRKGSLQVHSINVKLNSLRKYFDFLMENGLREDNPAANLRIKGHVRKVKRDILSPTELVEFWELFQKRTDFRNPLDRISHERNIVILGLMVFQGVHSGELAKMEVKDFNLLKGEVYVPGGEHGNPRSLELHPSQVLGVNRYLEVYRPLLLPSDDVFIPGRVSAIVSHMFRQIRKSFPNITNGLQIRNSVFVDWVKKYSIREAQYRCGHKQISTTEAYKQQDLEGLQNALDRAHPMG